MRHTLLLSAFAASLALSAPAFAQEPAAETTSEPAPAPAPVATTPTTTTVAPAAAPAAPVDTQTDHEKVVGRFGVGYMGQLDTPLGIGARVPAHIVGVRYWLQNMIAITGGLGFGTASSSRSTDGTTTEGPAATTFALKAGAALALASSKHYTFVIEPQLVFGYATQSIQTTATTIDNTGTRFALGATAGAEIHFGFIGIPELSLVGSIGLAFDTQSGKTKTVGGGNSTETAVSSTSLSTFTMANPWNIFSGNVAAIYYF